jgi:hypothetical protein
LVRRERLSEHLERWLVRRELSARERLSEHLKRWLVRRGLSEWRK